MMNAMTEYQQIIPTLVNQVKQLQQVIRDMKASPRLGNGAPLSHITPSTDTSTITSTTSSHPNNYTFRPPFHLYCHTHGLCAHTGKQCNAPSEHHKKDATFFKRMNGNDRNCHMAKRRNE